MLTVSHVHEILYYFEGCPVEMEMILKIVQMHADTPANTSDLSTCNLGFSAGAVKTAKKFFTHVVRVNPKFICFGPAGAQQKCKLFVGHHRFGEAIRTLFIFVL